MVLRSWRYAAPLVQTMPDAVLQEIAYGLTWWMEAASKSINRHEKILLDLCRRVMALSLEAGTGSRIIRNGIETYDPVGSAINHPIGHITQALINLWFKQNPNDNDLLPPDLKPMFTALCDVQVDRFCHGRVLLGSRLIALFRVDRTWTEQHLLPLFSWSKPLEAKAVWEGFLWSPRLYQPLMTAFKLQFLDGANHYAELGEHRQQFAAFLTYAALGPTHGYTAEDFRFVVDNPQFIVAKKTEKINRKTATQISVSFKPGGAVPPPGAKGATAQAAKPPSRPSSPALSTGDRGKLLITCASVPGVVWVYYLVGQS
jgi:hypothetical protein